MDSSRSLTENGLRSLAIPLIALVLFDFGGMPTMWAMLPFEGEMPPFLIDVATELGKLALLGSAAALFIGHRLLPSRAVGALGPEDLPAFAIYALSVPVIYIWKGVPWTVESLLMGTIIVALLLTIHSAAHYVGEWTPDRPANVLDGVRALSGLLLITLIATYVAITAVRAVQAVF